LVFALGSLTFTKPVGCTYTHYKSTVFAPAASDILIPDPLQWSPLVVENPSKSGLTLAKIPSLVKSAPYPPVATITDPYSYLVSPFLVTYSTPIISSPFFKSLVALHLVNNLANSPLVSFSISSNFSIRA
jgi:hypothetical protein